ncbi:MAG: hypothetical protein COT34_02040 [Candidatus Nealsonbacteria bacterium CG08_land_8_20_14_0_20_43_11]|uniref:Uncharacterized protein n=1 Tax=Candidatus Nealsonbacteria bacterium CG08_land_8_20_14_0_20_43_11 TaxID=1974706 RepID=A0A2M6T099_9BACT|nr:MAG: hypothetical protein COT34_02040 [Candidatus Nealsonbacteria bacterium CG08_land_8_20_14_0_20_43_11]
MEVPIWVRLILGVVFASLVYVVIVSRKKESVLEELFKIALRKREKLMNEFQQRLAAKDPLAESFRHELRKLCNDLDKIAGQPEQPK